MTVTEARPIPNYDTDDPAPATNGHRTPPHDLGLEAALIGAALLDPQRALEHLTATAPAIYSPLHRHITDAILTIAARGDHPDAVIVDHHLTNTGHPGNGRTLVELQTAAAVSSALPTIARQLTDLHRRRQLIGAAHELDQAAHTGDTTSIERWRDAIAEHATTTPDSSWTEVDLAPVLDGEQLTQPPTILHRDDGQALLYPGKVHAFNAESESGKSWLALYACAEQIQAGNHVLYLDFEDGAEGVTERLLALGVDPPDLLERFHYVRPDDPINAGAIDALAKQQRTVVVIDGVTEAMTQNGWSIKENDDVAHLLNRLARPFARQGSTVVLIDHVVKRKEDRGDDAIGGQHKRAGIDGASYKLEMVRPFGRGMSGAAKITVTKDRPGHIRPACVAGRTVGELRLASTGDTATLTIAAPTGLANPDASFRPTHLMEKVSLAIEEATARGERPTRNAVLAVVRSRRKQDVTVALEQLITDDYVARAPGPNRSQLHTSIKPYRETEDIASDRYEPLPSEPLDDF